MKPKFGQRGQRFLHLVVLASGPAFFASFASGASTWIGNTNANWNTGANWSTAVAPTTGESLVFGTAGSSSTTLNNDITGLSLAGITFNSGGAAYTISGNQLTLTGGIVDNFVGTETINNAIITSGTWSISQVAGANTALGGNLTGNATITQAQSGANGSANSLSFSGDNSSFTGSFTQNNSGNLRTAFNAPSSGSASAAWTFNRAVNGGVALNGIAGGTIHFGSLSGGAFMRSNTAGTTTVSVGNLGTATTWTGQINDNGNNNIALTKVGSGTLTLTAANSYDGVTTVNGGTLDVTTGTITNSAATINSTGLLKLSASKTIAGLTVATGGTAQFAGNETITNNAALTGTAAKLDLVNGTMDTVSINGATGLTLGGANATDTAQLKLEAGTGADKLAVANGLAVDAGGASITITNLGISAGQSYPLISFTAGSGAGFATGTGVTVGALTLANPGLSFGVSGQLEVTSTGVNLITTGATPPASAYWSGANGSSWNNTSGSNANFTTTAAGGSFLNVLPGSNTHVFFSNNSPSNPTNTLGENFSLLGLTYRASSAAVSTSGANTLTLGTDGITVEAGNGGAQLAPSSLVLSGDQTWTNHSTNPLVVSATSISGPAAWLTLDGTGGIQFGGSTLSVLGIDLLTHLDVKGTSVSGVLGNSSKNITNTGAANATISSAMTSDTELSGTISDNGVGSTLAIAKSGGATLTLSGTNTYGGGSSVSNGTLKAGSDSAFGTGPVTITSGTATLDLNGKTIINDLNNNGATGCVITNSSATTATVSTGFNAAGATGYVVSDFKLNGTGDIFWTGSLRRTNTFGVFTKDGTNQVTFNGAGIMSGMSLVINQGIVNIGKTTTSIQDLTINGGTLKMDPANQVATANIWAGTIGNTIIMNGGIWDLNDTGTNGVNNRSKRISGTGGTITNSGTGDSLLVLAARDVGVVPTVSWAGNIQDGGNGGKVSVSITDGGSIGQVMIFSGSHTYSGTTNILRNTMRAGAVNVFSPNSEFILSNHTESTLDLNGFNNTIGALSGTNPNSKVLLGTGTLTVGSLGYSGTFNGIISGTGGITKTGAGSLSLTGANTYTGDTTVNNGILVVDGAAIPDTNKLLINSGGAVDISGNETVSTLVIEGTEMPTGTYGATGSGAANIDDTHFAGAGILIVGAGYNSWASAHAGSQSANLDFDADGVSNGVEYFMNASAGFTPNPGLVSGSVSWSNGGNIPSSAYGTQFVVQTSGNLNNWTDVASSDPNLNNTTGSVQYTLPTGSGKLFVRLVVTPN